MQPFKSLNAKKLPPGTVSTEQAAKHVGISYVTLRRWLASHSFVPSHGFHIGGDKTIWRFGEDDLQRLKKFKDAAYCKGRGRAPRLRERVAEERNAWKTASRRWEFLGKDSQRYADVIKRMKVERRYWKILSELWEYGLQPRDGHLVPLSESEP